MLYSIIFFLCFKFSFFFVKLLFQENKKKILNVLRLPNWKKSIRGWKATLQQPIQTPRQGIEPWSPA